MLTRRFSLSLPSAVLRKNAVSINIREMPTFPSKTSILGESHACLNLKFSDSQDDLQTKLSETLVEEY